MTQDNDPINNRSLGYARSRLLLNELLTKRLMDAQSQTSVRDFTAIGGSIISTIEPCRVGETACIYWVLIVGTQANREDAGAKFGKLSPPYFVPNLNS